MQHQSARVSGIALVDLTSGESFPCAPAGSVLMSSVPLGWRGIVVECHLLAPRELPEHYVVGHGVSVSTSKRSIPFGWRGGKGWRAGVINPGEFHLLTHGAPNAPRWLQAFDQMSLVLDRRFVADLVRDGLPAERVEFATQRSARDPTIARYARAFRNELAAGGVNGLLYAETLAVGFALHLLSRYAVARPTIPLPRGRLNPSQLHTVVDYIQSHLDGDASLLAVAEQANVSPFHFARQFRTTVGIAPHQFILRQRIHKAIGLIEAGKLPLAQVAVECGFHDQPHFTRAFRKLIGTTPAAYGGGRRLG